MQTVQTRILSLVSPQVPFNLSILFSALIMSTMSDPDEAPPEVHHYNSRAEVPWDIQKYVSSSSPAGTANPRSYWHQRHKLFSKYDQGVWLTDDAWFGVTPEPVAESVRPLIEGPG